MPIGPQPVILWCGRLASTSGYGMVSRNHLYGLNDIGARVVGLDTNSLRLVGPPLDTGVELRRRAGSVVVRTVDPADRLVVVFHERPDQFPRITGSGRCRIVGHSVFETDGLPAGWREALISMDEVWVATEYNRATFTAAGVPSWMLHKIPHSLDAAPYQSGVGSLRLTDPDVTSFLTICSGVDRRDLGLLFRSFLRAFAEADVALVVKTRDRLEDRAHVESELERACLAVGSFAAANASQVKILAADLSHEEMVRLHRGADVYVSVERANGWDLPTMESMAAGRAAIGFDVGGSTEYATDGTGLRLPVGDAVIDMPGWDNPFYEAKRWPVVDEDDLVDALRALHYDPELRSRIGTAAQHQVAGFAPDLIAEQIVRQVNSFDLRDYRANSAPSVEISTKRPLWRTTGSATNEMADDLIAGVVLSAVRAPGRAADALGRYRRASDLRSTVRVDEPGPVASAVAQTASTSNARPARKLMNATRAGLEVGRKLASRADWRQLAAMAESITAMQTGTHDPSRPVGDAELAVRRQVFGRYGTVPLSAEDQARLRSLRNRNWGERCFVIGNGPSLNETDLAKLAAERTFAVNKIFLLYDRIDWRPTYYTLLDWRVGPEIASDVDLLGDSVKFFPNRFRGLLLPDDETYWYTTRPVLDHIDDQFGLDIVGGIPSRGTVLVTAIQLAFYLGFRDILLIGVDAAYTIPASVKQSGPDRFGTGVKLNLESTADDDPNHFDPRYFGAGAKWHDPNVDDMVRMFRIMRKGVELHGGRIRNATVGGHLDVFERVEFDSLF